MDPFITWQEKGIASFVIPIPPRTKKNHSQIVMYGKRPKVMPSKQYLQYKKDAAPYVPSIGINEPVTVKAIFYMETRRKVDISNLISALHDVLVDYECLEDDNCRIIVSTDGSRVGYDKEHPRTEVTIIKLTGYEHPFDKK